MLFATFELTLLHAGRPQVVALDYSRQGITSVCARLLSGVAFEQPLHASAHHGAPSPQVCARLLSGVLRANGTLTSLDLYRQAS